MNLFDHMRARLGMYVPVNDDGIPADGVWMALLREVVEGGIGAFRAGRVNCLEIHVDENDGSVFIRYDGIDSSPERMFAMCNGDIGPIDERRWYGGLIFPLLNVLSERLEVEIIHDGRWRKLKCGHGRVGGVEELLPLFPRQMSETCVRFTACDEYREASGGNIYEVKLLKNMAKAIAFVNPTLKVVVNGSEMFYEEGVEDVLRETVARSEKMPLIPIRQVSYGTAKISLAVVRRNAEGRRITLRTFVNGWECHWKRMPADILTELSEWVASCPILRKGEYDCVCFVEGRFPGGDLWQNGLKHSWSDAAVTFDFNSTLGAVWRSDIRRCWPGLFKEFVG